MESNLTLKITSLLSIILFALHWIDEISRGLESGTIQSIGGIAILVFLLCGPLMLAGRRSGYIIMLLGGIFGLGVLVLHMQGAGIIGRRIAGTPGIFFWVLTLIALGTISTMSAILAGRALWNTRSRRQ